MAGTASQLVRVAGRLHRAMARARAWGGGPSACVQAARTLLQRPDRMEAIPHPPQPARSTASAVPHPPPRPRRCEPHRPRPHRSRCAPAGPCAPSSPPPGLGKDIMIGRRSVVGSRAGASDWGIRQGHMQCGACMVPLHHASKLRSCDGGPYKRSPTCDGPPSWSISASSGLLGSSSCTVCGQCMEAQE